MGHMAIRQKQIVTTVYTPQFSSGKRLTEVEMAVFYKTLFSVQRNGSLDLYSADFNEEEVVPSAKVVLAKRGSEAIPASILTKDSFRRLPKSHFEDQKNGLVLATFTPANYKVPEKIPKRGFVAASRGGPVDIADKIVRKLQDRYNIDFNPDDDQEARAFISMEVLRPIF